MENLTRKFKLGQVVMTRNISDEISDDTNFSEEIGKCLKRYINCDWGEMEKEDKEMNNNAVKNNDDRIFAAYRTSKGKVYIITEWDRSYTTIMFASDY